jgi:hypothetical protein
MMAASYHRHPIPPNLALIPRLDIIPQLPLPKTSTASQVPIPTDLDESLAALATNPRGVLDAVANILAQTDMRALA